MGTCDSTDEPSDTEPAVDHALFQRYEIRVRGHLDRRWARWFDGMVLTDEDDGTTVLRGPVVDQAALHGLLHRLRDLGIPLVALTRLTPTTTAERPVPHGRTHHTPGATS